MGVRDKKLEIMRDEIEGSAAAKDVRDWMFRVEPLVMLALVVSGVKPGATLPVMLQKSELTCYKKLLKKLQVPHDIIKFAPEGSKAEFMVIDVASSNNWLRKFENGQLTNGEFYGYPACCQKAYKANKAHYAKDNPHSLKWVGLSPCNPNCTQATMLAQKYNGVIKQVLPPEEYRDFKQYWEQVV